MHCRCPHCRNAIEIAEEQELTEIQCPSCGSSFHLVSEQASTKTAQYQNRSIAHFELLEQVGVGSFGAVWKARDKNLDRVVALKVPRTDALAEPQQNQFFKEARAAAQIKHPNIVSVHEVGRENNQIYIVSDFIEGATLSAWIKAKPPSTRGAAQLCATIADALHAAHAAGVIHRDLKPANILMDLSGTPHIADFGLAKRDAGEITMTMDGQILGTPAYMSPEQAKGDGHNADRRSDVYSIGAILYQLLTGELPFRGDTRMLIVQILQDEATPLRKLSSQVPRDLETICLKCLNKSPERRYQTAKQLSEDLQRWIEGERILARPASQLEQLWRWSGMNSLQLAGLYAILQGLLQGGSTIAEFPNLAREPDTFASYSLGLLFMFFLIGLPVCLGVLTLRGARLAHWLAYGGYATLTLLFSVVFVVGLFVPITENDWLLNNFADAALAFGYAIGTALFARLLIANHKSTLTQTDLCFALTLAATTIVSPIVLFVAFALFGLVLSALSAIPAS